MILKLLDNTKTLSALNSDLTEGLGRLPEATKATVTEERNGGFILEFSLPITAKHYSELTVGSIVKAKPNRYDSEQMFRIVKVTKPINGIVSYKANHISYDLNKTSVSPFTAAGAAGSCSAIMSHMTGGSEFTISTTLSDSVLPFKNEIPQSARALFGGQTGSLLDVFGGEWYWNNLSCELKAARGSDRGVKIAYGKNITDIRQDENIENMYTAILPYVKMSADEPAILGNLQTIVASNDPKILNLDVSAGFSQDDTITAAMIDEKAQSYILAHNLANPKVSISVSFVNLSDTEEYKNVAILEQIRLCDTVTVEFPKLGIDVQAKVVKTIYDVLNDKYVSIEIGEARSSLSNTINEIISGAAEDQKVIADRMADSIAHSSSLISGGLGGYVVIGRNADGHPEEILIMDNPDKTQAVNVIRFNQNGIGFSTTGYGGPYTNAWTIDGQLNADFIKSGTIDAIAISGSSITFNPNGNAVVAHGTSLGVNGGVMFSGDGDFTVETGTIGLTAKGEPNGTFEFQIVGKNGNGSYRNTILFYDNEMTLNHYDSNGTKVGQFVLNDNAVFMRNEIHNTSINIDKTTGIGIFIGGSGYTGLHFVNDGNGHAVLGK